MTLAQSIELAWAAGFFDGEGNARIETSADGKRSYIRTSIGQVEREPLDRFMAAVGGVGRIYGPYKKREGKNWQPIWTYSARGASAQKVLAAILPYLCGPKCQQAADVIGRERFGRGLDHCKLKTHCPQGHAYNTENTYIDNKGYRHCKSCWRQRDQRGRPWRYSEFSV